MFYSCDYCSAIFKTNAGHKRHMCTKKALAGSAGNVALKRAYMLFSFWYTYNGYKSKSKTFKEYLRSPYFKIFVDLDDYVSNIYLPNSREYLKWCIDNDIQSKNWCNDDVSDAFIKASSRDNDPFESVVKSIEKIARWCEKRSIPLNEFFKSIKPGEALDWIQSGKLDPWVLLSSDESVLLTNRFSEEQLIFVNDAIDLEYWNARMKVSVETVEMVKSIMDEVGMIGDTGSYS